MNVGEREHVVGRDYRSIVCTVARLGARFFCSSHELDEDLSASVVLRTASFFCLWLGPQPQLLVCELGPQPQLLVCEFWPQPRRSNAISDPWRRLELAERKCLVPLSWSLRLRDPQVRLDRRGAFLRDNHGISDHRSRIVATACLETTEFDSRGQTLDESFPLNALVSSIGSGNTTVVEFSTPISTSVCR